MLRLLVFLMLCSLLACQQLIDAPVPDLTWAAFDSADNKWLQPHERKMLEGVYTIGASNDDFGDEAALKWSYKATKNDTTHYLSFFCAEDVRYLICQGKRSGEKILLNGYWRNIENTKTGKVHLTVSLAGKDSINIAGVYGLFDDEPEKPISFTYARPLYDKTPYVVIAHRGGGRSNDLLPASENSVEMIMLASQLGANGIEIDVQTTKDTVPVLFHDANITDRTTTKTGIHKAISSYSFSEIQQEVNLKRGGKIPTLEQALETVLYRTPLEFVWLDCKYKEGMQKISELQQRFMQKATAMGRKLTVVIGIPDEDVFGAFKSLDNYKNIPALCELDTTMAAQINAAIWAPSKLKGKQNEKVAAWQSGDRKAFVWTVDIPDEIKKFIYESNFNGMVTNRPTMASYYHLSRQ